MNNPLDIEIKTMNGENTTLRALGHEGTEHWVVVNVASACGFTRQYAGLQTLSQQDGVTVVGFPCNQFGAQEPGTHQEICDFTAGKFEVDFPLMAKIDVKGDASTPLFQALSTSSDASGYTGDIRWNFAKFVINADGNVSRFTSRDEPEDLL
ncbi:MAG: glutathione peroxidase [Candidatus Poseidoniaceae archaeon]|nr:glutathione peroxidase [Candidatus Poseidoniaceae archaeon]